MVMKSKQISMVHIHIVYNNKFEKKTHTHTHSHLIERDIR